MLRNFEKSVLNMVTEKQSQPTQKSHLWQLNSEISWNRRDRTVGLTKNQVRPAETAFLKNKRRISKTTMF